VVCSAHNVTHHEKQAATHYLNLLYNSYDRIIAHAKDNKQKLVATFNVNQEKIHVIPVGEYSLLAGELKDKTAAKKILGILPDRKVVLFLGYIRKYKGIGVLLESLAIALQSIPEIFLIIAGEPKEDFSIYEQTIDRLNLADIILSEIKYIPVAGISTYFSASDIVALPYLNIYQSGILYLAYAYQRPVIATNVGGLPEVVEQNKSGFIVPPNDPTEFARAIEQAFADLTKLDEMGQYAYQKAKQDYSWEGIADKTVGVYERLMGNSIVRRGV
jgi:D-inositol-3-phosphate glycosyltransferase